MPVKFLYDQEYGLKIETSENDEELTEQQAMIVAVRDLASGMDSLSRALWDFEEEFRFKHFYDEDASHRASPKKAPAKKPPTKRSSKKRRP